MNKRIYNYYGKNISAGHMEGISQQWATELPHYLGDTWYNLGGIDSRASQPFNHSAAGAEHRMLWPEWQGFNKKLPRV